MKKIMISTTARQQGFGSDRWKSVSGLTAEERDAARSGALVLFQGSRRSGGNHGTCWRKAVPSRGGWTGRFMPRVPSIEELASAGIVE